MPLRIRLLLLLFIGNGIGRLCSAFVHSPHSPLSSWHGRRKYVSRSSSALLFAAVGGSDLANSLPEEISAMKVREIKAELKSCGIGTEDVFEKEALVERLAKVRRGEIQAASDVECGTDESECGPRPSGAAQNNENNGANGATSTSSTASTPVVDVPLVFYSLESFRTVDATNAAQSVYVRPSPGQFACIEAEYNCQTLTLLVDTACSGLVLRPSSVSRLKIQTFKNTFGRMAAAGGNANTAVAQLESLKIGEMTTGAMPAAVQDIGALPNGIDGIIGLAVLNQYATVDMSFQTGRLQLYRRHMNPSIEGMVEIARTKMNESRLKIFTVRVLVDGRGPVTMLVDTGAASSILNWRGLDQMGLARTSPEISPTPNDIGAIGADNVVLRLTHRYVMRKGFNLVSDGEKGGLPGVGLKSTVNIDIGDIPVLESLANENVGGILGADLLMQSDVVRLNFRGPVEGQLKLFGAAANVVALETELEEADPTTHFPGEANDSGTSNERGSSAPRRKKKKIRSD